MNEVVYKLQYLIVRFGSSFGDDFVDRVDEEIGNFTWKYSIAEFTERFDEKRKENYNY